MADVENSHFLYAVESWLEKKHGVKNIYKVWSVTQKRVETGHCHTCYDNYDELVIEYELDYTGNNVRQTIDIEVDLPTLIKELTDQ